MIVPTAVLVPVEVAAELARFAEAGRGRIRARDGWRMSAPCERLLAELQLVARVEGLDLAGTRVADGSESTLAYVTPSEYAKRHGDITPQAVTERCRRGTLPAELVNGKWRIYPEGDESA